MESIFLQLILVLLEVWFSKYGDGFGWHFKIDDSSVIRFEIENDFVVIKLLNA